MAKGLKNSFDYEQRVPELNNWFPKIFSAFKLKDNNCFDGDRNHSRKLYNATCVTYDDEDIDLIIFLEDKNVQVQVRYIEIVFKYLDVQALWITFPRYKTKV